MLKFLESSPKVASLISLKLKLMGHFTHKLCKNTGMGMSILQILKAR